MDNACNSGKTKPNKEREQGKISVNFWWISIFRILKSIKFQTNLKKWVEKPQHKINSQYDSCEYHEFHIDVDICVFFCFSKKFQFISSNKAFCTYLFANRTQQPRTIHWKLTKYFKAVDLSLALFFPGFKTYFNQPVHLSSEKNDGFSFIIV